MSSAPLLATDAADGVAVEPRPTPSRWRFLRSPLLLLGVLLVASTAARAAWISIPDVPVVDETFYVSAGRHIASLPADRLEHYAGAPQGVDPNIEHPPLAKLFIAWSMRWLGDRPLGWRLPSLVFGTLAVAAVYWVARGVGAGGWESLGAAALLASDNMFVVYGRLATLDIFVAVFMLVGVGLYLRRHPAAAGVVVGIGACTKLVGFSALAVLGVIELLRRSQDRREVGEEAHVRHHPAGLALCALVAVVSYLALLGALDQAVTDYPDPISHTRRMLTYAEGATFQAEAQISGVDTNQLAPVSKPWQWLLNQRSYTAHRRAAAPPGQPGADKVLVHFRAMMSPPIIFLAVPAFLLLAYRAWAFGDEASNLALAWIVATFGLYVVVVLRDRVSYMYYVVTFLPGVHLALARAFSRRHVPRLVTAAFGLAVLGSFVAMYPLRTWAGQ